VNRNVSFNNLAGVVPMDNNFSRFSPDRYCAPPFPSLFDPFAQTWKQYFSFFCLFFPASWAILDFVDIGLVRVVPPTTKRNVRTELHP